MHYTESEIRTAELFSQDYRQLTHSLRQRPVIDPETGVRGIILETQGFSRIDNSSGPYKPLLGKKPSEIFCCYAQGHLMALVAALDETLPGACVKLHRVGRVSGSEVVPLKGVSAAPTLLNLQKDSIARLAFLDDSQTLYVVRNRLVTAPNLALGPTAPSEQLAISEIDKIVGK